MSKKPTSVRSRFLGITVPLIFLSVMGVFSLIELMTHRDAEAQLEAASQARLRTQAAALANPLWNIDAVQIRLSLEAVAANREIALARVYGERGEVIAEAGEIGDGENLKTYRRDVVVDAGGGQRKIGEIELLVSSQEIWEQTRDRLLLAGGIALLAVTMEVGAALFALRRIIGRPLEKLLAAINEERAGHMVGEVAFQAPDEMGQVITSFNDMIRQQREFEAELQQQARMEGELAIGRDLQLSLVPHNFDDISAGRALSLWGALEPAREVGGDFYDAFLVGDNQLCFCIGDVSDKGVPAALMMAVTKTMVKSFAIEGASPSAIVAATNDELCGGDHRDMFVTLLVAILDLETGSTTFTNAGHNPPIHYGFRREPRYLEDRNGPVVGAMPGLSYSETNVILGKSESLLLYTDGITEAAPLEDDFFGETRLLEIVQRSSDKTARELIEVITNAVDVHEGGTDRSDDVTMLAVTYEGAVELKWEASAEVSSDTSHKLGIELEARLASIEPGIADRILLILDEIVSNIFNHASTRMSRAISVHASLTVTSMRCRLIITDDGPEYDPDAVPPADTSSALPEREKGGLGLHLVREMSDVFQFDRRGYMNVHRVVLKRPDTELGKKHGS